jgi:RecA-family ATPase
METYATIPLELQQWEWQNWIARDVMTYVAGAGGIAKGRWACNCVASFTAGYPFPDGYVPETGWCLTVTPEDRDKQAMKPRLTAERALPGSVVSLTWVPGHGEDSPNPRKLRLDAEGLSIIREQAASRPHLRMIYLDPFMQVKPRGMNASNNDQCRDLVEELDALAVKFHCAVLMTGHLVKDGTIGGSAGLVQAARHVLLISRLKSNPKVRQLKIEKSNIGPDDLDPFYYTLTGSSDLDRRIAYCDRDGTFLDGPHEPALTLAAPRYLEAVPAPHADAQPRLSAAEMFHNLRKAGAS